MAPPTVVRSIHLASVASEFAPRRVSMDHLHYLLNRGPAANMFEAEEIAMTELMQHFSGARFVALTTTTCGPLKACPLLCSSMVQQCEELCQTG